MLEGSTTIFIMHTRLWEKRCEIKKKLTKQHEFVDGIVPSVHWHKKTQKHIHIHRYTLYLYNTTWLVVKGFSYKL